MEASATDVKQTPKTNTKATPVKKKKKHRHLVRKIIVTLLILLILIGIGWYLLTSLKAQYTVTYQPYTASTGTISNSLSFNGTLQAVNSASYSANSSGTVRNVYVKAGDKVSKGDKLVRLSTGQVVEAEFDGEVNTMDVAAGDSVSAGATLCQVVDFTHMKTNIRVDEYDINSVKVGDSIRVTTTATEKTFTSTISAINHTSSSSGSVAYYTATAYVDVSEGVYPGMQVTITLPQEEATDVVILKMDAISFDTDNSAFVYTMDESGAMQKTAITTGVSNGSYVEIKSGLKSGDVVYTEVETQTTSGVSSMLSGIFGGSQVMGGSNRPSGSSSMPGGGSFDFSSMPSGGSGSSSDGSGGGRSGGGSK